MSRIHNKNQSKAVFNKSLYGRLNYKNIFSSRKFISLKRSYYRQGWNLNQQNRDYKKGKATDKFRFTLVGTIIPTIKKRNNSGENIWLHEGNYYWKLEATWTSVYQRSIAQVNLGNLKPGYINSVLTKDIVTSFDVRSIDENNNIKEKESQQLLVEGA